MCRKPSDAKFSITPLDKLSKSVDGEHVKVMRSVQLRKFSNEARVIA